MPTGVIHPRKRPLGMYFGAGGHGRECILGRGAHSWSMEGLCWG